MCEWPFVIIFRRSYFSHPRASFTFDLPRALTGARVRRLFRLGQEEVEDPGGGSEEGEWRSYDQRHSSLQADTMYEGEGLAHRPRHPDEQQQAQHFQSHSEGETHTEQEQQHSLLQLRQQQQHQEQQHTASHLIALPQTGHGPEPLEDIGGKQGAGALNNMSAGAVDATEASAPSLMVAPSFTPFASLPTATSPPYAEAPSGPPPPAPLAHKRRARKAGGAKTPKAASFNEVRSAAGGPASSPRENKAGTAQSATAAAVMARQHQYRQQQQLLGSQVTALAERVFRGWGAEGVLRQDVVTSVLQHWYLMQLCWGVDRSRGLLGRFMGLTGLSEGILKEAASRAGPEAVLQRASQAPTPVPPLHPFLAALDDWAAAVALHVSDMREGVERVTTNGRFEENFIGAKAALERLCKERLPFAFLLVGLVSPEDRERLVEELMALTFRSGEALQDRHMVLKCTDRNGLTFLGIVRIRTHRDLARNYFCTLVSLQPLPLVAPPPRASTTGKAGAPSSASSASSAAPTPSSVSPKPTLSWLPAQDGGRWRYAELTLAQDATDRVLVLERWGGGLVRGDGWGLRTLTTGTALFVEGSRILGVRPAPRDSQAPPSSHPPRQESTPPVTAPAVIRSHSQPQYPPATFAASRGGITRRIFPQQSRPLEGGHDTRGGEVARGQAAGRPEDSNRRLPSRDHHHQPPPSHPEPPLQQEKAWHEAGIAPGQLWKDDERYPHKGGARASAGGSRAPAPDALSEMPAMESLQQYRAHEGAGTVPSQHPSHFISGQPPSLPAAYPPLPDAKDASGPLSYPWGAEVGARGDWPSSKRARSSNADYAAEVGEPASSAHSPGEGSSVSAHAVTASEALAGWTGGEESPAASQALEQLLQVSETLPPAFFEAEEGLPVPAASSQGSRVGDLPMAEWQFSALENEMVQMHGTNSLPHVPAAHLEGQEQAEHDHGLFLGQRPLEERVPGPAEDIRVPRAPALGKTESSTAAATILMLTAGKDLDGKESLNESSGGSSEREETRAKDVGRDVADKNDHLHFLQ